MSSDWGPGMAQDWDTLVAQSGMAQGFAPSPLTVSDVERLAKAGVKIEFEQIKGQIVPDAKTPAVFGQLDEYGYIKDFIRRWDRAQPNSDPNLSLLRMRAGEILRAFDHISIARRGETFHVFVVLTTGQVGHLTDPAETFPSEALIAKVFLLKKEGKPDGNP